VCAESSGACGSVGGKIQDEVNHECLQR